MTAKVFEDPNVVIVRNRQLGVAIAKSCATNRRGFMQDMHGSATTMQNRRVLDI